MLKCSIILNFIVNESVKKLEKAEIWIWMKFDECLQMLQSCLYDFGTQLASKLYSIINMYNLLIIC